MRILSKDLRKGFIEIVVENDDDLWILYNVIHPGDIVTAKTVREVKAGENSSSSRIPMILSIKVSSLEFQPFTDRLRIRGVVVEGPEKYGVQGKHHTLSIGVGSKLVVWKENWLKHQLEMLEKSSIAKSRILVVVLDYDEACIAVVSDQGVKVLYEVSSKLPGKLDPEGFTVQLNSYLKEVSTHVYESIAKYGVDILIIASPGDLSKMLEDLVKNYIDRIYRDQVSIGGCSGLNELLRRDVFRKAVRELSIIDAEKVLEEFKKLLITDHSLIAYGLDEVEYAVKNNAVKSIVISSDLVRSVEDDLRSRVNELLEEAYRRRAEIIIVPHDTDVGREVKGFGGILALLRYSLPKPSEESIG